MLHIIMARSIWSNFIVLINTKYSLIKKLSDCVGKCTKLKQISTGMS